MTLIKHISWDGWAGLASPIPIFGVMYEHEIRSQGAVNECTRIYLLMPLLLS